MVGHGREPRPGPEYAAVGGPELDGEPGALQEHPRTRFSRHRSWSQSGCCQSGGRPRNLDAGFRTPEHGTRALEQRHATGGLSVQPGASDERSCPHGHAATSASATFAAAALVAAAATAAAAVGTAAAAAAAVAPIAARPGSATRRRCVAVGAGVGVVEWSARTASSAGNPTIRAGRGDQRPATRSLIVSCGPIGRQRDGDGGPLARADQLQAQRTGYRAFQRGSGQQRTPGGTPLRPSQPHQQQTRTLHSVHDARRQLHSDPSRWGGSFHVHWPPGRPRPAPRQLPATCHANHRGASWNDTVGAISHRRVAI